MKEMVQTIKLASCYNFFFFFFKDSFKTKSLVIIIKKNIYCKIIALGFEKIK